MPPSLSPPITKLKHFPPILHFHRSKFNQDHDERVPCTPFIFPDKPRHGFLTVRFKIPIRAQSILTKATRVRHNLKHVSATGIRKLNLEFFFFFEILVFSLKSFWSFEIYFLRAFTRKKPFKEWNLGIKWWINCCNCFLR